MRLSKYLRHGLTQNILALYGVHFVNYLLPLITVPYVARTLEPAAWGLVAFAQAFGQYVTLLVEYGFNLSATREVSRYRNDKEKLADLMAGVLGAKGLLALLALVLVVIVQSWVPIFQKYPLLLWASLFSGLTMAFSPLWFYQGLERMQLVAILNILTKVLFTAGIFLLVHSPEDAWKVIALPGVASFVSTAVVFVLVYREVPFRFPVRLLVWDALRKGWTMFIFNITISFYTVANTFILGLFAPPEIVGYYAGAEKINKVFIGLSGPISQALYPRFSHLVHHDRDKAAQLARVGLVVMGIGSALMGLIAFLLAPLLVRILLGEGFEPAIPVLQVLALIIPFIAVGNVLGVQWMIPLGLERSFNAIVLGAGCINLSLAVLLAPRYGELGMAYAVLFSEIFVALSTYVFLRFKKLTFWHVKSEKVGK